MTRDPVLRRLAQLEQAVDDLMVGLFRAPNGPATIRGRAIKPKNVTASLIDVSSLEAVNTKTGNLNVTGNITMTTSGVLSAGQTAYDTGVGFWLEYNAGIPRFSLGNSGGSKLTWDGSALTVKGNIEATTGEIGGFVIGSTDLTTDSGATGIASSGGYRIWVGNATPSAAPFRVSSAGVVTMYGATIGTATGGARVDLNPTGGLSLYDAGGAIRARLSTDGSGYLGSTDGTSATAALSWTSAGVATINASAIKTGTLNCAYLTVTNLSADSIVAGTISANRVSGGNLGGSFDLGSSNITLSGAGKIIWNSGNSYISASEVLLAVESVATTGLKMQRASYLPEVQFRGYVTANNAASASMRLAMPSGYSVPDVELQFFSDASANSTYFDLFIQDDYGNVPAQIIGDKTGYVRVRGSSVRIGDSDTSARILVDSTGTNIYGILQNDQMAASGASGTTLPVPTKYWAVRAGFGTTYYVPLYAYYNPWTA